MSKQIVSKRRRRISWAAVVACIVTFSCAASVSLTGKADTPMGSGEIEVEVELGPNGEPVAQVTGGEAIADKCVEVTFSDASGADISTTPVSVGPSGGFSIPIPAGAVRLEGTLGDCPEEEEEEEGEDEGLAALSFGCVPSSSDIGNAGKGVKTRSAFKLPLKSYEIFGVPLSSDLQAGSEYAHYSFKVFADSHEEARSLVRPIIAGGIGAKVPGAVTVIKFTTITVSPFGGARMISAVPGKFTSWSYDFNNGAFYADLFSRSIRYQFNNWDVVEVQVPASKFDSGILPGATYLNGGVETYSVNYLSGIKESAWAVSAVIN